MTKERLWERYVLRRNSEVAELWTEMLRDGDRKVLYLSGLGFDPRMLCGLKVFNEVLSKDGISLEKFDVCLIESGDYELPEVLLEKTVANERELRSWLTTATIRKEKIESRDEEGLLKTSIYADQLIEKNGSLDSYTDIILDVSSLPRVVYLTLLTGILGRLVIDKERGPACLATKVNLHVVVAENAALDSQILSEEIDNDVKTIKGFSGGLGLEVNKGRPVVWFPILGEDREAQLRKVYDYVGESDICPVIPHPTIDPRRGDNILIQYSAMLFDEFRIEPASIMYADEGNPFEVYRQLRDAMMRYCGSLKRLGGCSLLVTPLSSKLITIGAGLACFEMHDNSVQSEREIGIPYPEPHKYRISGEANLDASNSVVTMLLLTGQAYAQ